MDLPVVYLTAYADEHTLRRARATQPYGYIIKPFQERELRTAIEKALYKHQMEQQLHERERWLDTTLCSIGDAVIATDRLGNVVFMNGVAERLTGQPEADARQRPVAELLSLAVDGSLVAVPCPAAAVWRQGQAQDLLGLVLVRSGQEPLNIEGNASPICDERGGIQGVVLAFRDVSRRKREQQERERIQARLFEAEQSEAVGVLAGNLLHVLNHAFTTIAGSGALAGARLGGEAMASRAQRAEAVAWQAARQARQVLAVHRDQMPDVQLVDLNALLAGQTEAMDRRAGERTSITWSLAARPCPVLVDATQISQAIANLVDNAVEAMPQGGTLTIETGLVDDAEGQPGSGVDLIRLSITDTGMGIDPAIRMRMFEPFFSAGKPGATGLGLAVARGIILYHGGRLEIDSSAQKGTTVHVYLPRATQPPAAPAAYGMVPAALWGRGERVLLVEQDDALRLTMADMLNAAGYEVVAADTALTGPEVLETGDTTFDLLLTSVTLPDRDGLWLADRCLAQCPGLAVLLSSAYADNRSRWMEVGQRGLLFLPQPFSLPELLSAVRSALAKSET